MAGTAGQPICVTPESTVAVAASGRAGRTLVTSDLTLGTLLVGSSAGAGGYAHMIESPFGSSEPVDRWKWLGLVTASLVGLGAVGGEAMIGTPCAGLTGSAEAITTRADPVHEVRCATQSHDGSVRRPSAPDLDELA